MSRLLLLPLLAPLLAVLITAGLNPRPSVALRLLTWQSQALPLGAWLAAAALTGAALSGGATALALREAADPMRRRLPRRPSQEESWPDDGQAWPEGDNRWRQQSRAGSQPQAPEAAQSTSRSPAGTWSEAARAGPTRQPGEPAPTVAVPYRVLHRRQPAEPAATPAAARGVEPVPVADDWGMANLEEW